jgi:hypothetical protein
MATCVLSTKRSAIASVAPFGSDAATAMAPLKRLITVLWPAHHAHRWPPPHQRRDQIPIAWLRSSAAQFNLGFAEVLARRTAREPAIVSSLDFSKPLLILRREPDDEPLHVRGDRRRPVPRRADPSYFLAINSRYQRRIVSGVTRPANSPSRRRPIALPLRATRRRWSSVSRSRRPPSCSPKHAVLLLEVVDDL